MEKSENKNKQVVNHDKQTKKWRRKNVVQNDNTTV